MRASPQRMSLPSQGSLRVKPVAWEIQDVGPERAAGVQKATEFWARHSEPLGERGPVPKGPRQEWFISTHKTASVGQHHR